MGCVREDWEGVRPQNLPRWRRPRARGPLLSPTSLASSASWAGWTGFCGCPGWGHLPVGASQGAGAGNLACLSPRVVRSMTCLPTPRDRSCHAASHQGSGEGCHQDPSVLRGQLASSSSLPCPESVKVPGAGLDAPPAHALPCLTPGPPRRCAELLRQLGDGSGPAPSAHLHKARDPEAEQWGAAHSRRQGPGCSVGKQEDTAAEAGR